MNWLVALGAVPSLLISCAAAGLLRAFAPKWGFVDLPGERKIHRRPLALGGGLAIWAGVAVPFALAEALLIPWSWAYRNHPESARLDVAFAGQWAVRLAEFVEPHLPGLVARSSDMGFFLACGSVLVLLGLIDDTRGLDWRVRLAVETLVAAARGLGRGG
jgi:UDP-GlcNAc:undecaprenyl-phosphate GlcNAc-1-phosphate transferase